MFLRRLVVEVHRSRRLFSSRGSNDLAGSIAELNKENKNGNGFSLLETEISRMDIFGDMSNLFDPLCSKVAKEMESIFGEPPPDGFAGSASKDFVNHESPLTSNNSVEAQEPKSQSRKPDENVPSLTHIGCSGEAQMVDVSSKDNTKRTALASCKVMLGKKVFDLVLANQLAKGDVLGVAKLAGINGAKQTSSLIPLCHNIALTHVRIDLRLNPEDFSVDIEGEASCTGKTGVEMEAMTAVSVAGLTVYDMCKAASKDIQVTNVRLERKTGGKSGYWSRED